MVKSIIKSVFLTILLTHFSSCNGEKPIQEFSDNFYTINPYWNTSETTDKTRFEIVTDPLDDRNNVLLFHLFPDDFNSGGKRNEFVIRTKDTIGYKVEYSFKFMFPESFFKPDKEQDRIMIHQWHDKPPLGISWQDYKMLTRPPVHLYIQVNPDNKFYIIYAYGLWNKDIKELRHIKYEQPLLPNEWYKFENTIKWEMDESGYSIPKINGEYLIKPDENEAGKIYGPNMFNDVPNYFKMGLYGNYKRNDTISVFIDEFRHSLYNTP